MCCKSKEWWMFDEFDRLKTLLLLNPRDWCVRVRDLFLQWQPMTESCRSFAIIQLPDMCCIRRAHRHKMWRESFRSRKSSHEERLCLYSETQEITRRLFTLSAQPIGITLHRWGQTITRLLGARGSERATTVGMIWNVFKSCWGSLRIWSVLD